MNVGIVGAGRQGKRRAAMLRASENDRLVVVADVDTNLAQALVQGWDDARVVERWQAVVEDPAVEVVIVSVPPHLHGPIAIAAAEAGKHILVEKPLARTPEEGEAILAAAERHGVLVKCGFNLRFHPAIKEAHHLVQQGAIGPVTFMRCRYGIGGRPGYDKEWRAHPEIAGGGELIDRGVHMIDLYRWFMGDFAEAYAMLGAFYWRFQGGMEDNAFGLLRTTQGQIASFHVSATQWRNIFSLEVFGTQGYILVSGLGYVYGTETLVVGRRDDEPGPVVEQVTEFPGEDRSWVEEWREFASALRDGRQPLGSGQDGMEALRLLSALYQSARTGHTVRL